MQSAMRYVVNDVDGAFQGPGRVAFLPFQYYLVVVQLVVVFLRGCLVAGCFANISEQASL